MLPLVRPCCIATVLPSAKNNHLSFAYIHLHVILTAKGLKNIKQLLQLVRRFSQQNQVISIQQQPHQPAAQAYLEASSSARALATTVALATAEDA
jgi:hypothetical protein